MRWPGKSLLGVCEIQRRGHRQGPLGLVLCRLAHRATCPSQGYLSRGRVWASLPAPEALSSGLWMCAAHSIQNSAGWSGRSGRTRNTPVQTSARGSWTRGLSQEQDLRRLDVRGLCAHVAFEQGDRGRTGVQQRAWPREVCCAG